MTDTNKIRARQALKAVNLYRKLTGQRRTTCGYLLEESVIDLVTNLRHLANQKGIDWGMIERSSKSHFLAETHEGKD